MQDAGLSVCSDVLKKAEAPAVNGRAGVWLDYPYLSSEKNVFHCIWLILAVLTRHIQFDSKVLADIPQSP
jgi:hypothetical protein